MLTCCVLFLIKLAISAQQNLPQISTALKNGKSADLINHFDLQIDLSFSDNTNTKINTYSKKQALVVLQNFFSRVEPNNYVTEKRGTSTFNNTKYCIGMLSTGHGKYKVYMFFKQRNEKYLLKELRFEKQL